MISALGRKRQEDRTFKASLSYVGLCLISTNKILERDDSVHKAHCKPENLSVSPSAHVKLGVIV